MKLLHFVSSRLQSDVKSVSLAEQIAERCFERAWQRVAGEVQRMAPAEARGFVRARAADVLGDALGEQAETRDHERIYARAMNSIVRRVLDYSYEIQAADNRRAA